MANNKNNWSCPKPAIRVSKSVWGKADQRGFEVQILDKNGEVAATVLSSEDGKPILKCGAKVAIKAPYGTLVTS